MITFVVRNRVLGGRTGGVMVSNPVEVRRSREMLEITSWGDGGRSYIGGLPSQRERHLCVLCSGTRRLMRPTGQCYGCDGGFVEFERDACTCLTEVEWSDVEQWQQWGARHVRSCRFFGQTMRTVFRTTLGVAVAR